MMLSSPLASVPENVDLRPLFTTPKPNQGNFGACVLNTAKWALNYQQARQGFPTWDASRLFMYYNVRQMEGTGSEDAGCQIRDAMKTLNRHGACYEALWPYDEAHFAPMPSLVCYEIGENHQLLRYARVGQDRHSVLAALIGGTPILFGVALYQSFMSDLVAATGDVPMPSKLDTPVGGHCMLAVGFEKYGEQLLVANWWDEPGQLWGDRGFCRMPLAYLMDPNLADDFWMIQGLE